MFNADKWKTIAVLCAASLAPLATTAAAADFDGMVAVGNGQLHAVQAGDGPYTVVFEGGFGGDLTVWRKVAPAVAKRANVLVYSRAGTGKSPARAQPVTLAQSAAELSALLAARQLKPPYILVGHSYGGFVIRAFAASHPVQVAGMVLVDPADEGLERVLRTIDAARVEQDQRALQASMPAAMQGDLQLVQQLLDAGKLPAMAALPDVPSVLLTSVRARAGSDYFQETPAVVKIKRQRHADFMTQFSTGAHVFTSNSGHMIQMQEPELVIDAIAHVQSAAAVQAARLAKEEARRVLTGELEQVAALLGKPPADAPAQRLATALAQSRLSEAEINGLGFDLLLKARQQALAELVLTYNVRTFPQSDNAADSYGEALLAGGRAADAQRQFAQALTLGRSNGASARALAAYQEHLSQAEQALNKP